MVFYKALKKEDKLLNQFKVEHGIHHRKNIYIHIRVLSERERDSVLWIKILDLFIIEL